MSARTRLLAAGLGAAIIATCVVAGSAAPALADSTATTGQQVIAKVIYGLVATPSAAGTPTGDETNVGGEYPLIASQGGWDEISMSINGSNETVPGWLPSSDVQLVAVAPASLPLTRWVTLAGEQNETGLSFYAQPDAGSQNLGTISKSYVFEASSTSVPADGNTWFFVQMQDGTSGWMENPVLVAASAPSGTSTTPTTTPSPAATSAPSQTGSSTSSSGSGGSGITPAHAQDVLKEVAESEKVWHLKNRSYGSLDAVGTPDPSVSVSMTADGDGYCANDVDDAGTVWWVSEQATTPTSTKPSTATAKGCPAIPAAASTPAATPAPAKAPAAKPASSTTRTAAPAKSGGGFWSWVLHHMPWWGWLVLVAMIPLIPWMAWQLIKAIAKAGVKAAFRALLWAIVSLIKAPFVVTKAVSSAVAASKDEDLSNGIPDMRKMNDREYQAALAQLHRDELRAQAEAASAQPLPNDDEPLTHPGAEFDEEEDSTDAEALTSEWARDVDASF